MVILTSTHKRRMSTMKTRLFSCIALCLAACLLLSGCSGLLTLLPGLGGGYSFSEFLYTRPDTGSLCQLADQCIQEATTAKSASALMDSVYSVFYLYNDFQTNYSIANIRYCQNTSSKRYIYSFKSSVIARTIKFLWR